MKVLLLVDIQNDFLPGGALAVPDGDAVVPVANRLQEPFERVIASQDWHPPHHVSFASQHPGKEVGEIVELPGLGPQILWPDHCIEGSYGAALNADLETGKIEKVFFKGVDPQLDSYSAFFDNAHRRATGLGDYLKASGIDEIFLVGLALDYCVKFTAIDAVGLGFKVRVVEDGCRAVGLQPGDGERALDEIRAAGADLVRSTEILARV